MEIQLTLFYQNVMSYLTGVQLGSVVACVIALLYVLLVIIWRNLLRKSKRDHEFGESLLSEREPKSIKIKLIWEAVEGEKKHLWRVVLYGIVGLFCGTGLMTLLKATREKFEGFVRRSKLFSIFIVTRGEKWTMIRIR